MAFTTDNYNQLATGLQTMMANGNEAEAKRTYNEKLQQYGAGFDRNAFAAATKNMGFGGANGFSADQINQWAGNPQTQATTVANNLGLGNPLTATSQGYTAQSAGPAAQAGSQGYNASQASMTNAFGGMGMSDPSKANSSLLSGQVNNAYLDKQADNIQMRLNRNLNENIMPGIGQGATMAGGYGGSRMGIAQGKAIADTQDNYAGQMANLYGTANENAQNRMAGAAQNLSGLGAQTELANAGFKNTASQFGANAANTASMFNAGQTNQNNQFNVGQSNAASQFGANANNQNSQFNAGQVNSYNLGLGQLGNQATSIANQNNQANANNALGYSQLDSNNAQFGANFGLQSLDAQNRWANNNVNTANTIQNTPINYFNGFNQNANQIAGQGTSTSQTNQANPWVSGAGGAIWGNKLWGQP